MALSATAKDERISELQGTENTKLPIHGRIDVHHHFVPPCYAEAFNQSSGDPSGWSLPVWTAESSKRVMLELAISTTILSLTAPGCTILHGPAAAKLARSVNEHAASIRDTSPTQFGFFATLPPILDDMDATLAEIAYSLDVLKADGITLYTRYGQSNQYLGHPDFLRIWTALDARKAVVFIHPTHTANATLINPKVPQPIIDYPHETARTTLDLIMSDTVRRHPHCRIILSHAGGTFPYIATRAAHLLPDYGLNAKPASEFLEDARSLYYDLALSSNEHTLGLLLGFARPEHVLFGTDFPYAPMTTIRTHTMNLDNYKLSKEQGYQITRGNALSLFPRLAARADWDRKGSNGLSER